MPRRIVSIALLLVLAFALGACAGPRKRAAKSVGGRDPQLVSAIIKVESGGNPRAVGADGQAIGALQIRPIMVEDVNRILGRRAFRLSDRWDVEASVRIFWVYADYYSPGASREVIARRWNGGPRGDRKSQTSAYWRKVRAHLD